jgi:peptide/nickel transport system permease protein
MTAGPETPDAAATDALATDTPAIKSPREIARARRRASLRRNWNIFRHHRGGMFGLAILIFFVLAALLAPLLFPRSMLDVTQATGTPFAPPSLSPDWWLGADESGRSVLARLAWGTRVSLTVGIAATIISMVIGTTVGIVAGHYRGWTDTMLNGLSNWFLVIPFLPLAVVLATVLGASLINIIIVIGITSWPGTARLIRAQTLSVEGRPYLERARALGGGNWHQMSRHVLPNVMPLVLANTTLTVAIAILSETALSFLGLGDPLEPSWGGILDDAFTNGAVSLGAWWYVLSPGVCVVLVVMAFTLIGRALEQIFDPRLQGA